MVDERHDFLHQKFGVAVGAAAAEFRNLGGRVLVYAGFAGVVDADDEQGFDRAALDQVVCGALNVPVLAGKGCGAIKEILAVVEIKDREATPRLLIVAGREIDDQVALIPEEARAELVVFARIDPRSRNDGHQGIFGLDVLAVGDQEFGDSAGYGGVNVGLHFHGFEGEELGAALDRFGWLARRCRRLPRRLGRELVRHRQDRLWGERAPLRARLDREH